MAADERPTVLEGQDGPDKIVILEFPDEITMMEFHSSADYQQISIDRKAGADALVLPVQRTSALSFKLTAKQRPRM